ncbi:hypothetical protein RKE30_11045 [Streptomyces sp. Li-HN-5-11]|uniref:hypothetical protein n=1 Tax=Streptomyces sp. Li-HN-5-11 TaxID=3075432 RepID=UPI0028A6A97C|nr:hypothetical protein [Streptomyces sp. Li-HN-5-11]WNM30906.1 hypothetical protein RKE30_11045 [Streptomyces sp. Li-HN-5-11]
MTGNRPAVSLERRITGFAAALREDAGYREPSRAERLAVADAVGRVLDGRLDEARALLPDVGFRLRTLTDSATGRRYAELSDRTEDGPAPRGWGRVYVGLPGPVRWSVQVPHPTADALTERLGARVLLGSPGGVMVLAGAHRRAGAGNAADVAHRTDSVFDAVCDELARRRLPAVQVHGFADASAPGYDVVVSTGRGTAGRADGRLLADALQGSGFTVCRAWARSCPLEGRGNVQGRRAGAARLPFLHVEFARSVRVSDARLRRAVEAVDTVTVCWAEG